MRVDLQPGYVLHSRPYRDSSLILEVFTAEHGRLSLMARGARRRRRGGTQSALLQAFIPLLLSYSGRAEMMNLAAAEVAGQALSLKGDRLFSALYVNELLVRLLHRHDPHPALFASYAATLSDLVSQPALDVTLRRFEFGLLEELGYGFALDTDGRSGAPVEAERRYRFDGELGLVEQTERLPGKGFPGDHLLELAAGQLSGGARRTARQLLREALASHLGPQPLHSRALFRAGRRSRPGGVAGDPAGPAAASAPGRTPGSDDGAGRGGVA